MSTKYDKEADEALKKGCEGDLQGALEEFVKIRKEYGLIERIVHSELCIYSLQHNIEKAKNLLELMLSKGFWLNPKELEDDRDLNNIRGLELFQKFMFNSQKKYEERKKDSKGSILRVGSSQQGSRCCFWIPGKGTNITEFKETFQTLELLDCYDCYYLQSSQVYAADRYCWDNEEKGIEEIENALIPYKEKDKLLCGISQGGRVLLNGVLTGKLSGDLFLIIPALTEKEVEAVKQYVPVYRKASICIVTGDLDLCYANTCKVSSLLREKGYKVNLFTMKKTGHYIPDDFPLLVHRLLEHGIL